MASTNVCTFTGNLGADPEFNVTSGGTSVCNINLAVTNYDSQAKGTVTMWLRCAFFGKQAEFLEKYAEKGDKVAVTGSLRIRSYKDRDGHDRTATEILGNSVEIVHSAHGPAEHQGSNRAASDDFDPFLDDEVADERPAQATQQKADPPTRRAATRGRS